MTRARGALPWAVPCLLCLLLHWRGLTSWFRADDFAWLGTGIYIRNFHDFLTAMFAPQAQGTIRPISERGFFMLGFSLFGLEALPFKIIVFATQFVSLTLMAKIGARLTGSVPAGVAAACLWTLNASIILPLGWTCVYNEVLEGMCLLLAFYFLLRFAETGARRYEVWQWVVFLLGFGVLELNVVYPALAGAYTLLVARKYFRRVLPMFAVSIAYVVLHNAVAPVQHAGDYGMHFTGAIFRTLGRYWTWSIGPTYLFSPIGIPEWALLACIVVITIALFAFAMIRWRDGSRLPLFCIAWYLAVLSPVLPLRDHLTEYYVFLPMIGVCWLGGWAIATKRAAGIVLATVYALMTVPEIAFAGQLSHNISIRVRDLVEGVAAVHELYPSKSILLVGVDTDLFWNGILDRPFRLFGADNVYLAPDSEKHIDAHPNLGDIHEYVLPSDVVTNALKRDQIVVYDVRGPRLRNITELYAGTPREASLPSRVDAASTLTSYLLGPEWYASDGDHRWMPKRATLRIAGPSAKSMRLYLRGQCPDELLRQGPVQVDVAVDGVALPPKSIRPGENAFEIAFDLPDSAVGKVALSVTVEVARRFRPPSDQRDLSLAFGVFEIR